MGLDPKTVQYFTYDLERRFNAAMRRGLQGALRQVPVFVQLLNENLGRTDDVQAELTPIAKDMRERLVEDYEKNVESVRLVAPYTRKNRLSGSLKRALQSPTMAVADGTGISYIDRELLDAEAKHWKRLNFGAAGSRVTSSGTAALRPVYFDERVLFYVGSKGAIRPAFTLPPGQFISGNSTMSPHGGGGTALGVGHGLVSMARGGGAGYNVTVDKFFPGGKGRTLATGGIVPRHYIDGGFIILEQRLGTAMDNLLALWSARAREATPGSNTTVRV